MHTSTVTVPLSLILLGLASSACGNAPPTSRADTPESEGGGGPTGTTRSPHHLADNSPTPEGLANLAGSAGEGGSADPGTALVDTLPTPDGGSDSPLEPDSTPPQVVRTQPENGAVGVLASAPIVIEFSEPMDREATQHAFASPSLPGPAPRMTWNDAGTILTVTPGEPLEYAHTALADAAPLELAARTYDYALSQLASDRAGNPLAETHVQFSTLREVSHTLTPVKALTGALRDPDDADAPVHGFVTFDAATPPAGIVGLQRAVAELGPYGLNQPVPVFHVEFTELADEALDAPAKPLGVVPSGASGTFVISPLANDFLRRVYLGRTSAQHYLQLRLDLPASVADAEPQAVNAALQHMSLVLDYVLP